MKGAPSIAVMLGHSEPDGDEGESDLASAKSEAKDGARALISAISSKNPDAVYRAFGSLKALCDKIHDLEDSGEKEHEAEEDEGEGGEEHEDKGEEY